MCLTAVKRETDALLRKFKANGRHEPMQFWKLLKLIEYNDDLKYGLRSPYQHTPYAPGIIHAAQLFLAGKPVSSLAYMRDCRKLNPSIDCSGITYGVHTFINRADADSLRRLIRENVWHGALLRLLPVYAKMSWLLAAGWFTSDAYATNISLPSAAFVKVEVRDEDYANALKDMR